MPARRFAGAWVPVVIGLLSAVFGTAGIAGYQSPEHIPGTVHIGPAEAWTAFRRGVPFVDVRIPADYEAGRIPGAVNLTIMEDPTDPRNHFTEAALLEVAGGRDVPVVLYCNALSCWRTAVAAERAVGWGFTGVRYFRVGFPGWLDAGYPVE